MYAAAENKLMKSFAVLHYIVFLKEIIKEDMVLLKSESGINFLLMQVNQQ